MATSGYDFWVLDLDGTVLDVEQSYIHETMGEVGHRLGYDFSDREAELLWYGIGNARETLLADADIDAERFWRVFHDVEEPGSRARSTYVYDDAAAFVSRTQAPVGVVTHCQEYLTLPILDRLGIEDWFETIVCCDDETGWKPDPAPVQLAMDDMGVGHNGHAGAMAGDMPADVRAAHNAGLDAVHVSRPDRNWEGDRVLGDRRVSSLTDLGV
ncbi:HAD family hydrolase [Halobacteriales archaeon SW_10_68_16]|jgi:phosphoglycolate phosphatase|nr:MAG: HAD family hydrolase [Halobacteriales archaeon SW_10_68_16]